LRTGQSVHYTQQGKKPFARLLAPIVIRGETIGVIGYEEGPDHQWQTEEIAVLETIASRVGLAIENARLLNEAQLRAEREQKVAGAASHIRETLDLETVLRTAAQEFKRTFALSEAEVRITDPEQIRSIK
jgi:GAF domain-containing protein